MLYSVIIPSILLVPFAKAYFRPDFCPINKNKHPEQPMSTFLWKIEKNPPSYFFGRLAELHIHIPYTKVWQYISPIAKEAFNKADTVVLELDLSNPNTRSHLRRCQNLPRGHKLSQLLSAELLNRLKIHMQYIKSQMSTWMGYSMIPFAQERAEILFTNIAGSWHRRRPIWLLLMLNSLNEGDIRSRSSPVLDLFLAQEANSRGQTLTAIEKVRDQCGPLNSLNTTQVVQALDQTLSRLESLRKDSSKEKIDLSENLVRHYQCGSLDESIFSKDTMQLPQLGDEMQEAYFASYFHEKLIVNRNIRMAERVDKFLQMHPNKSMFFAFGAGHFIGDKSIIDLVRLIGHNIVPVISKVSQGEYYPKNKFMDSGGPVQNFESVSWLKRDLVKKSSLKRVQRRQFEELWIRMNNFTPKSWHEIAFGSKKRRAEPITIQELPTQSKLYFIHHTSSANFRNNIDISIGIGIILLFNLLAFDQYICPYF